MLVVLEGADPSLEVLRGHREEMFLAKVFIRENGSITGVRFVLGHLNVRSGELT